MAGLHRASFEGLRGGFFRGSGHADDTALMIVRRPTQYLRSIARPDIPARASRRIAAYSSTFDTGGMRTPRSPSTPIVPPQPLRSGHLTRNPTSPPPRSGHPRQATPAP